MSSLMCIQFIIAVITSLLLRKTRRRKEVEIDRHILRTSKPWQLLWNAYPFIL